MKVFRKLKFSYWLCLPIVAFIALASITNVPTRLQPEDVLAIKAILGVQKPLDLHSFDDEIRVIRWAQSKVMRAAPGMEGIPEYSAREPLNLIKAQSGLCYDRSRTIDKTIAWLGFETRHVYILFADPGDELSIWQFLAHMFTHSSSHAVTEVKTSRGWLMVGSNTPFISMTKNGEPVPAGEIHQRRDEFSHPPEYVDVPLWAIRGMYSRKGQFYRPYFWFPEFNWPDFLSWALTPGSS